MKKTFLCCLAVLLALMTAVSIFCLAQAEGKIDNSSLMPKYVEDSKVKLDEFGTPEWAASLMICNFRIELASDEGTFRGAVKALDHLAETGVNGVWLSPIFEKGEYTLNTQSYSVSMPDGTSKKTYNGFVIKEIDKLDPAMGTWEDLQYFVAEAHKRNIRVFFDVVPHGVSTDSSLAIEHPDWFYQSNGKPVLTWGFSYDFDWNQPQVCNYYANAMIDLITRTNADGLRLDVEPQTTGKASYVWQKVKEGLWKKGKKIVLFPEHPANDRGGVYDFEQCGLKNTTNLDVDAKDVFLTYNIVDEIYSGFANMSNGGSHKYYTYPMSVHDSIKYYIQGSVMKAGYNLLFSPYIPIYFLGEEWNNTAKQTLYFNWINYDAKEKKENAAFYEKFKQMVRIRRQNADIFEYFPNDHRDSNICKVPTNGKYQAYARYAGNRGILIIPNDLNKTAQVNITIPFEEMGIEGGDKYKLTDLMSGKELATGTRTQIESFGIKIAADGLSVIAVDKIGGKTTPTTKKTTQKTDSAAEPTTSEPTTVNPGTEPTIPTEQPSTSDTEQPTTSDIEQPTSEPATMPDTESVTPPTTAPDTEPINTDPGVPTWIFIAGGVAAAAVIAVVLIIILRKRKA